MNEQSSLSFSGTTTNDNQPYQLPTNIFKQLRNNDTPDKILQATVEIIYQALKCDRVVVYSLESDSMCRITAEAVTPGYAQILNRTIRDVCFESGYIEKYQKGRIKSISDVGTSNMTACHLETLKEIDVKANLVVPMINQDTSLYGLLVMHQCSKNREWQRNEVEFVLEVADWTIEQLDNLSHQRHLTIQLSNGQKTKQLIDDITKKIHGAEIFYDVLQMGVDKAQAILNCDRVIVYCLQNQSMGKIVSEATVTALAPILGSIIKDPCFEYRYIDQYKKGRVRSIPDIYQAGMTKCYVENLAKIGVRSNLVAPIIWDDDKIYGLLVAHQCFDFKEWQINEIEYFKEIALHMGLSLSKAKLRGKLQSLETSLKQLASFGDTIVRAQSQLQQINQPIQQTNQILIEVNNLNKLLEREVNLINQSSSVQTRKDTKLIQIMIKKLAVITANLRKSLYTINSSRNEVNTTLNELDNQILDHNS